MNSINGGEIQGPLKYLISAISLVVLIFIILLMLALVLAIVIGIMFATAFFLIFFAGLLVLAVGVVTVVGGWPLMVLPGLLPIFVYLPVFAIWLWIIILALAKMRKSLLESE